MERMTIGQLAEQACVNGETVRYYERRKLLRRPSRSVAGYRVFSDDAVKHQGDDFGLSCRMYSIRLTALGSFSCSRRLDQCVCGGPPQLKKSLEEHPVARVQVFAVWEPILPTDWMPPTTRVLGRVSDSRVRQFWDKERTLAKIMADSRAGQAKPDCCTRRGTLWDLIAVFPEGGEWRQALPPASVFNEPDGRSDGIGDGLLAAVRLVRETHAQPCDRRSSRNSLGSLRPRFKFVLPGVVRRQSFGLHLYLCRGSISLGPLGLALA
jgi:hypothetical protein